jgi:acetamidase/formamidase
VLRSESTIEAVVTAIPATPLQYEFSRHARPRAEIDSGAMLIVDSEDALSGQLRLPTDRRNKQTMPWSNPVNGPIVVRGAEPGDALAVQIESIEPLIGQCATYTGGPKSLAEWLGTDVPPGTRICPIRDGQIFWSDDVTIPYAPMLGCLGTAPDWGVPTTGPAGNYGGNLDLIEVCPGNTVYLPVFVPGGYLYLGDVHAAQGHGELSATALEMPARTTIRVDLRKHAHLPGPRIESATEIMTVAVATPVERAIAESYARLILWLEADFGWNRWQAYDLLTQVGQLSIGYYATGAVAAKVAKRYITKQKH